MDTANTASGFSEVKQALIELRGKQRQRVRDSERRIKPAPRNGLLPLSFQQENLWFLDQIAPGLPVYTIPFALRLRGDLDVSALEKSLAALIARHEALRTRFGSQHGVPHQVIDAPQDRFPFTTTDLRSLPSARRREMADAAIGETVSQTFDLGDGPLVHMRLVRVADDEYLFLIAVHHIIADGWSFGRFTDELSALYHGFRSGQPAPDDPLPLQSADVAVWQRAWLTSQTLEEEVGYWRDVLRDLPTVDFPTDHPRPNERGWAGAVFDARLTPELYRSVRELARTQRSTMLATLASAFFVVMARYTGQDDLPVGSVLGGRTRPEIDPLIGFFANSVVLRGDLSGDPEFTEIVARANRSVLGALERQELPFGKLVDALRVERDPSRNPLFQISFTLQAGATTIDFRLDDVAVENLQLPGTTARFDIAFQVIEESDGGARLWIEYSTELFERDRIERLVQHYTSVLEQVTRQPQLRASDIEVLTAVERSLLLREWTAAPQPRADDDSLLHDLVSRQAEAHPDEPAVRFGDQTTSYRELDEAANRLARLLREEWSAGPGTVVALFLDRGPEIPLAELAVAKSSAAWMSLDPDNPGARLEFQLADTAALVVITTAALAGRLPGGTAVITLDSEEVRESLLGRPSTPPESAASCDDLAYIIYTSGSTGAPKGVLISHRSIVNFVGTMRQLFRIGPGDRVLQFANPAFDVSVFDVFAALGSGACVVGAPKSQLLDPQALTALLRREHVTVADIPPALLALLPAAQIPDLRELWVGLEPFPGELVNQWNGNGRRFHNGYGPTEATIACVNYTCPPTRLANMPPIGRAMDNHRAYVLDAGLSLLPLGVRGELYVAGTGLARGYLGQPGLTAERFVPDPFAGAGQRMYRTGDLARWRADGNLEFVGRADNQIKIRGLRIEPGEIEHALTSKLGVSRAVVLPYTPPEGSSAVLVGYVVADARIDLERLREDLAAELPAHMIPSVLIGLESLPVTSSGKLDRKRLPSPAEARDDRPDRTPTGTERQLIEICRTILEISGERPRPSDNYFAIGGNSLNLVRLLAAITEHFGVSLAMREVLLGASIERISAAIDHQRQPEQAAGPESRRELAPTTAARTLHTMPPWLIPLNSGGTGTPFFLVHASGGSAVPYSPLVAELGDRPCYAFESPTLHGQEPDADVPTAARRFVAAMRSVAPGGPYLLGGWSIGGVIAHEMSCQLQAADEAVTLLVALDSGTPPVLSAPPARESLLRDFVRDVCGLLDRPVPPTCQNALDEAAVISILREHGIVSAEAADELRRRIAVFTVNASVALVHRPGRFDGDLTLLLSEQAEDGQSAGWDRYLTGQVTVHEVPGNHYTMLQPPHLTHLAAALRRELDAAYRVPAQH